MGVTFLAGPKATSTHENEPSGDSDENEVMETSSRDKPVRRRMTIQDFISVAYLYCLTLGILTDILYYRLLGINILYYSSILDVLLSPLVFLTKRTAVIGVLSVVVVFVFLLERRVKAQHRKQMQLPEAERKPMSDFSKKIEAVLIPHFVPIMLSMVVLFMFLGGGLGAGMAESGRIAKDKFRLTHRIKFADGSEQVVRVVGQKSDFVFFVHPGEHRVTVTPVRGNIQSIEEYEAEDSGKEPNPDQQGKGDDSGDQPSKLKEEIPDGGPLDL